MTPGFQGRLSSALGLSPSFSSGFLCRLHFLANARFLAWLQGCVLFAQEPVSQGRQSNTDVEFHWPAGSRALEAMPVAGGMDGHFGLSQTHTLGSHGLSQPLTTRADTGLPGGVVISVSGRKRNDPKSNASYSVFTETPSFHSSDV